MHATVYIRIKLFQYDPKIGAPVNTLLASNIQAVVVIVDTLQWAARRIS